MSIYLKTTSFTNGKVKQEVVKISNKPRFWEKEKINPRNEHYMTYQKNKKGQVVSVCSNSYDGTKTSYKLMQEGNKVRR